MTSDYAQPTRAVAAIGALLGRLGWDSSGLTACFLTRKPPTQFDGALAHAQVLRQMDFGLADSRSEVVNLYHF